MLRSDPPALEYDRMGTVRWYRRAHCPGPAGVDDNDLAWAMADDAPLSPESVLVRDALHRISTRLNAGERSQSLVRVEELLREAAYVLRRLEVRGDQR